MGTMNRAGYALWWAGLAVLMLGAVFLLTWWMTGEPLAWVGATPVIAGAAFGTYIRSQRWRRAAARGKLPCFVRLSSAGLPFRGKWRFGLVTPTWGRISFQAAYLSTSDPREGVVTLDVDALGPSYNAGVADTIIKLQRASEILPVTVHGTQLEIAALPKHLRLIESAVRQQAEAQPTVVGP